MRPNSRTAPFRAVKPRLREAAPRLREAAPRRRSRPLVARAAGTRSRCGAQTLVDVDPRPQHRVELRWIAWRRLARELSRHVRFAGPRFETDRAHTPQKLGLRLLRGGRAAARNSTSFVKCSARPARRSPPPRSSSAGRQSASSRAAVSHPSSCEVLSGRAGHNSAACATSTSTSAYAECESTPSARWDASFRAAGEGVDEQLDGAVGEGRASVARARKTRE